MSRLTTVNSNYFEASNLNGTVVTKIRNLKFPFLTSNFFTSFLNYQLSIIHYTLFSPCLRQYPSYLKRGVIMGLQHLNSPLKIREQVLPSGTTRGYDNRNITSI